jgi:hypothetical protein
MQRTCRCEHEIAPREHTWGCTDCGATCCRECASILEGALYCAGCAEFLLEALPKPVLPVAAVRLVLA